MNRRDPAPDVRWRDLLPLSRRDIDHELTLSLPSLLPSLLASWLAAAWHDPWRRGPLPLAMFDHFEHRLFPAAPTRRLPELARRLDAAAPGWAVKRLL